jgi:hypothetical protein
MKKEKKTWKESGVSETVGFILIFGIILTGIALVTLYGYPALLDTQQNANVRNMERNMISLQSDVNSLTYKAVPYKETTMQVSGGTLFANKNPGNKPNFTVTISGAPPTIYTFYPGEILFYSQDSMVSTSLENGAVHSRHWSYPLGSAMLSEPRWFYDETTETFVMFFTSINATEDFAQTGIGTIRMKLVPTADPPLPPMIDVSGKQVTITYNADSENNYNIAWRNYLNKTDLKMRNFSGDGFSSSFDLDSDVKTLVIKTYNVTILSL